MVAKPPHSPRRATRSDLEVIEASIRETVDGRDMIRNQPFVRIRATLATAATSLSEGVPGYDPVAILNATQPMTAAADAIESIPMSMAPRSRAKWRSIWPTCRMTFVPPRAISDQIAAEFVRGLFEATTSVDGGDRRPAGLCRDRGPTRARPRHRRPTVRR